MLLLKKSKQRHSSEMDFHKEDDDMIRSSRLQVFLKIDFPKKIAIFTGKRMYWSFFLIKLMSFRHAYLIASRSVSYLVSQ